MNDLPGTFSLRNHFSSSPLFRPRSRSQAPPEVRYFFRRNHFSSCRPAEPVRLEAAVLFSREPLFLLPSGRDWRSRKQRHWADRRLTQFFRGNHFPSFRWVHGRPVGRNLSPAVLSLALHCKEVAEFRQYRKRARRCSDFFRQHPDTVLAKVPKEMAPLGEMPNPERIKAHQSCAGCVCRDRIIGKYNLAELAGASLKRAVAFHCGNTVSDHEVDRNGRTDVEDAFVNSAPVQ